MGRLTERSEVEEACLATITAIQPVLAALRRCDGALASQLVRALTNMTLSAARARFAPRNERRGHLLSAVGSASEANALLQMAIDWHYCTWPHAKLGRQSLATTRIHLAKLSHRRPSSLRRRAA